MGRPKFGKKWGVAQEPSGRIDANEPLAREKKYPRAKEVATKAGFGHSHASLSFAPHYMNS